MDKEPSKRTRSNTNNDPNPRPKKREKTNPLPLVGDVDSIDDSISFSQVSTLFFTSNFVKEFEKLPGADSVTYRDFVRLKRENTNMKYKLKGVRNALKYNHENEMAQQQKNINQLVANAMKQNFSALAQELLGKKPADGNKEV